MRATDPNREVLYFPRVWVISVLENVVLGCEYLKASILCRLNEKLNFARFGNIVIVVEQEIVAACRTLQPSFGRLPDTGSASE